MQGTGIKMLHIWQEDFLKTEDIVDSKMLKIQRLELCFTYNFNLREAAENTHSIIRKLEKIVWGLECKDPNRTLVEKAFQDLVSQEMKNH